MTDTDPTAPEPKDTGTYDQPGERRQPSTYRQRCVRRAVPDPGHAETVTPAGGVPAGGGPASPPARGRSGRPGTPRGKRGPRPAPSPAHPVRTPRPVRPARPGGWHVERVDTVPITAEEHSAAVNALAVLISAWTQQVHDGRDDPTKRAT